MKTSHSGNTSCQHFRLYQDFLNFKKSTRGITPASEEWFRWTVLVFLQAQPADVDVTRLTTGHIVEFLGIYNHMPWRKHGFYRALKTFYKWISTTYKVPNPFMDEFGNSTIDPPKLPQKVLPALQPEQVLEGLKKVLRDHCGEAAVEEWQGVLSRLIAEESAMLQSVSAQELNEALKGDSPDYFTLWENRN